MWRGVEGREPPQRKYKESGPLASLSRPEETNRKPYTKSGRLFVPIMLRSMLAVNPVELNNSPASGSSLLAKTAEAAVKEALARASLGESAGTP